MTQYSKDKFQVKQEYYSNLKDFSSKFYNNEDDLNNLKIDLSFYLIAEYFSNLLKNIKINREKKCANEDHWYYAPILYH